MKPQTIRFIRRGQSVALDNVAPSRTLLELLREDLACTGTKEGCGEGDCGACTVVLGELEANSLRYRAVNSCIKLAHSVDGMALWTVEDLAAADGTLHPAQQAMVQCHGSQCGFCTPGFVMSLFGMYQNHTCHGQAISRELAQEELSGNLCRCTGYKPILEAAKRMGDFPLVRVAEKHLLGQLKQLAITASTQQEPASYPHRLIKGLPFAAPNSAPRGYLAPRKLADLLQARADHPQAQIVAGCTDVGLWVTKMFMEFGSVLDVTRVAELRRIERYPHHIAIGAAVPLTDAYAALTQDRPQLRVFANRFAGLPVRNAGTMGGNVANGSPIGDSMPLLIALGAHVVLMSIRGHREMPLEALYTGYRKNVMASDEVLAWIKVPLPVVEELSAAPGRSKQANTPEGLEPAAPSLTAQAWTGDRGEASREPRPARPRAALEVASVGAEFMRVYKISKRFDDDISAICLALSLKIESGRVLSASIGLGGVAATPVRARKTEAALAGKAWTLKVVQQAIAVLRAEFQPISDMRASSAYRSEVLGNLLQRFWLESQGMQAINLESFVLEEEAV